VIVSEKQDKTGGLGKGKINQIRRLPEKNGQKWTKMRTFGPKWTRNGLVLDKNEPKMTTFGPLLRTHLRI